MSFMLKFEVESNELRRSCAENCGSPGRLSRNSKPKSFAEEPLLLLLVPLLLLLGLLLRLLEFRLLLTVVWVPDESGPPELLT